MLFYIKDSKLFSVNGAAKRVSPPIGGVRGGLAPVLSSEEKCLKFSIKLVSITAAIDTQSYNAFMLIHLQPEALMQLGENKQKLNIAYSTSWQKSSFVIN